MIIFFGSDIFNVYHPSIPDICLIALAYVLVVECATSTFLLEVPLQRRSQNAEKVAHIKGRLLDQAVILFNCVPFWNGNFSGSKFFPLRANSYGRENHIYHIR